MEFKIDKILNDNDVVYGSDNYETFLNDKFKNKYESFIKEKENSSSEELKEKDSELVELFNDLHEIEELDEEIGNEKIKRLKAEAKLKKIQKEKKERERQTQEEKKDKQNEIKKTKIYYEKDIINFDIPKKEYMTLGLFPKTFEYKDQKFVPITFAPFLIGWKIQK